MPKTGVDVNFCAAVPKMRPKYSKILFFNAQNRGRCKFLCRDTFWDPKYSKILFFNVQNRGRKVVLHESVTDAHTDVRLFWRSQNMRKPLWRRSVRKLSPLLKGQKYFFRFFLDFSSFIILINRIPLDATVRGPPSLRFPPLWRTPGLCHKSPTKYWLFI